MLVFLSMVLAAAVDPALVGAWDTNLMGMPMSFVIDAGGRCALQDETFSCSTKAGGLTMRDDEGSATYSYAIDGASLTLSGGDMMIPLVFQRRGGPRPAPSGTTPPTTTAPMPTAAPGAPEPSGAVQLGALLDEGELYGSGDGGQAFVAKSNQGSWSAVGDAASGTLTLTFDDGSVATVPFSVSTNPADRSGYGAGVRFGNDLYQKSGDGGC